jgi:hypothetical protein
VSLFVATRAVILATMRDPGSRFVTLVAIVCALLCPASAAAQQTTLPHLAWRTLDTRHFRIYFTRDAEEWTRDVAARIDAAHDAVSALVGSAPGKRITVVVEDPNNVSNGFALPLLDQPLIFLWPTPPDPTSSISNGGWGDLLSIHEYAHIAHLTRESRNPRLRLLARLLPIHLGPIALGAPRWVTEGYATFVEGRIVRGIGRPHGVWRMTVLRQWAVEGQLPTYGALDGSPRYQGDAMAYLAGSAFLEWLAERNGDSSLVHLWRRMTARQPRSFDDAFTGVYGASPDELYGRFAAALTHDALDADEGGPQQALLGAARDAMRASGEGELVQRLRWSTGAPAISRDDSLLALVRDDPHRVPRVVIWHLGRTAGDSAARARTREELARDPEDVAAVESRPAALPVAAVLGARGGMSFAEPRFFPDGARVLLTALSARGDGALRRDLYVWTWRTGDVRRVTRNAGIRHADVAPDGASAIADRCVGGRCDLVRVDLASGAITVLLRGDRSHVYDRPRLSRDGRLATFAVQLSTGWHVATAPVAGGPVTLLTGSSANEYAPAFARGDSVIVVTSEQGGVSNIVRIALASGERARLTDVTGAAIDPDVDDDGWVYFLRMHARGLDLARVHLDSAAPAWSARRDSVRVGYPWAAHQPAAGYMESLAVAPVAPSRSYGFGDRQQRLLLSGSYASEGQSIGLAYSGTDPVGRLTWLAQGQWGSRGSWRGGSLGAVYRGARPLFGVDAFALENQPSHQHDDFALPATLDARYRGASAWSEFDEDLRAFDVAARVAGSYGTVDQLRGPAERRALAQLTLSGGALQTPGDWRMIERLSLAGAAGRIGSEGWTRAIVTGELSVRAMGEELALDGMYGRIDHADIPFEQFTLGGLAPPLVQPPLLAQRVPMPVLPIGVGSGRSVATLRASLPGPVWRPYYWAGSAGEMLHDWSQVVGIEGEWHTDGVWMVRVPGVHLLGGIGYSLSGAWRHHPQAYLSVGYRP